MGDLKTPWDNSDQAFTGTSVEGAGVSSRGSDPNADGDNGAGAGIQNFWDDPKQAMGENPSIAESSNSSSGLPSLPNRFEPSETPPALPDLTTRSPGTVDKP